MMVRHEFQLPPVQAAGKASSYSCVYCISAKPTCFRLELQLARRAASRALAKAGKRIAARIAIIAITTSNSMSVKPLWSKLLLARLWRIRRVLRLVKKVSISFSLVFRLNRCCSTSQFVLYSIFVRLWQSRVCEPWPQIEYSICCARACRALFLRASWNLSRSTICEEKA